LRPFIGWKKIRESPAIAFVSAPAGIARANNTTITYGDVRSRRFMQRACADADATT
jgi:hypothetical protein